MLSVSDRKLLLLLARERIESTLAGRQPKYPAATPAVGAPAGGFVTLHRTDAGRRALRGCIGQIDPSCTMYEVVREMAYSAAFADYRFQPVTADEWPRIDIEISVLSPLREITNTDQVVPGRHGLYVTDGSRSGLLLPQVASERHWNTDTFLRQTCRKAGLPEDAHHDPETTIFVFTAEVFDEALLST
jgi:AmmeMemoRadiSam system protein A